MSHNFLELIWESLLEQRNSGSADLKWESIPDAQGKK
jgi:hypothetical protein